MESIPQFYESESDFQKIHYHLKQYACPHCNQIGTLNLHGLLKGYDDIKYSNHKIRGHRIYCSNKYRRNGCAKTFSIILNVILRKFIISSKTLWQYLKKISSGINIFQSFHLTLSSFQISTAYRLIKTMNLNQSHIRTILLNKHPAPEPSECTSPLIETINHLQSAFKKSPDPIAAFQSFFQIPFLKK